MEEGIIYSGSFEEMDFEGLLPDTRYDAGIYDIKSGKCVASCAGTFKDWLINELKSSLQEKPYSEENYKIIVSENGILTKKNLENNL